VSKADLLSSTLEPAPAPRDARRWRVPSLTVLFHAGDPTRIGEVARLVDLLEGGRCALSRAEPAFAPGGEPLGDRHLSRTPAKLVADGDGVRLESAGSALRADGDTLSASRSWSQRELERGVVIEMADRVVLLLHLLGPPAPKGPDLGMVGASEAIERVRREVASASAQTAPVLLRGESGTGKELAARAIAAKAAPFVAVNLAAIPASMAASELFGHSAGAFTGATAAHVGLFAQADGGTLFLDEVAAAPLDVQAMLLRVLETGEVQPLGSQRPRHVDVRVIAATDEDLEDAIAAGRFREALFHRLASCEISLPPLRDRRDDLGRLLVHFLGAESRDLAWLPASIVARLARYDWPGNVRQLANVVRRLVLARRAGKPIGDDVLPPHMLEWASLRRTESVPPAQAAVPAAKLDDQTVRAALRANRWRIGATARALGISRTSLYGLIDASAAIRKAKDIPAEELRACHEACGGDIDAMSERLEVSSRGIRLRLNELGLA
jgi:transcriptional regulator with AAA-type ATPase domain